MGAATEAARRGVCVLLADEHDRPGGQLFKQIPQVLRLRGPPRGRAGYAIGRHLLAAAAVELMLGARAVGLLESHSVLLVRDIRAMAIESACIVLASVARENALAFPGWTLPGVMTAGAARTMVTLHAAYPGGSW